MPEGSKQAGRGAVAEKRSRKEEAPRHSAAHRVEYALARTLETAVSALPERAADGVGRRIGRTIHRLGIRRKVVEENLRLAFPGQPAEWIHRTSVAAYEHLGREAAAILRLSKLDRQAIVDRTVPVGWDEMEEALSHGRGVMLVTGHYGNWEIAAATVASRGLPIAAIVRRQGNRLVDERLNALRARLGVEVITQREAPSRVPRLLRKNAVIGIVGDQDARGAGVFVPFFGRPASTHRGPAVFALKLGAPVFACVARRLPGAAVRYEVSGHGVPVVRTGDLEVDTTALTAALAARLEEEIRRAPEQYFWFHRRWKSSPPAEQPSSETGTVRVVSAPADPDPDYA
ncbi:MAG TPA: lysophospholipid acyltransferase family protein [Longimicrobium sp.]|jgi:KDO2-lipid IV(A) lauroyltransferase|nr:lysophospholipid acyltransferase family protein [Longimicrobium sp.]